MVTAYSGGGSSRTCGGVAMLRRAAVRADCGELLLPSCVSFGNVCFGLSAPNELLLANIWDVEPNTACRGRR